MKTIRVSLKDKSYDIRIGKGILRRINFRNFGASQYAIITDSIVKNLYGRKLQRLIEDQRLEVELIDFPAGEVSKNWVEAGNLGRKLAKLGFDRDSLIIALGGGVVGDLTGFIASFYLRGIDYIQMPTTLLAQVDSSIGGKTGVDIPEGKNLFGYFHQPKEVCIDIETLETLPEREIKNGLAEIIKYGMTQDRELFEFLEKNIEKRNENFYLRVIETSARIKSRIIEHDEKEKELRKILNYGHTIGHAIEGIKGYRGITHGEAVAIGMVYEGKISSELGFLKRNDLERQNKLIDRAGLPTRYKGNIKGLLKIMKRDKKSRNEKLYFVLPIKIGKVKTRKNQIAFPVKIDLIRKCLLN
jgi:3-dehydroquinate synthase